MPVKIWLPWKRQVTWTVTCHIKLLPDKFWKKSPSLVAFALILKKLLTSKVTAGRIRPSPPGLDRVNELKAEIPLKRGMVKENCMVHLHFERLVQFPCNKMKQVKF